MSPSYTNTIVNIGFGIPCTYDKWKDRIIRMYEEHQCHYTYNQAHRIDQQQDQCPGNQKQITAPSSKTNTTGGMTSSLAGKMTGDTKGRDSAGLWTTPTGADAKMQVDRARYMKEELCF